MSLELSKNPRDIVFRPIVSEKAYGLIDQGKYVFEVDTRANKTEIKEAVEEIFSVKVEKVNTANRQGKRVRTRTGYGRRNNTKRAIVTLREGSIDIFGESVA
ncbi:MAG: 50S ribosomal protein L23 [Varibaculum sp.]|nr:50S ribosomal protein L23 [Varibaculum sp.]